ncbi:MAG: SpoIIE family protein phosphatase [Acidobacteria bacterium]|nr:SpoIIE family protein phosphatase [Acidobacteriota bacterium]
MLPKRILAKKSKWVWIAFLALSPFAYGLGIWLNAKYDPHIRVGLGADRAQMIAIAARYVASRGIDVSGWSPLCRYQPQNDLMFYYRLQQDDERGRARTLVPEATVGVLFRNPNGAENLEVVLSHDGRPLGFQRFPARTLEIPEISEAEARQLAQEAIKSRLAAAGLAVPANLGAELKLEETPGSSGSSRRYTWKWPFPALPELTVESVVSVRGNILLSDRVLAKLDPTFASQRFNRNSTTKIVSILVYALLLTVVLIFGLYRFAQRARQKEVSYSRVFILATIFAIVMSAFIVLGDTALYQTNREVPGFVVPDWLIMFSSTMVYLVIGLFMGLAYGSGEGDIREAYIGKLSSLDALLFGKVFSRNVARSVVVGCAFAGWIMLGVQLAFLPWQGRPGSGEGLSQLADAWIGRAPGLSVFLAWPMDTVLVTVVGLLLPLPFLHRRKRLQRYLVPVLFLFVWVACAGPYLDFQPWTGTLMMAAVRTAFLLLAFFEFDLLTAIISLAVPTFVSFAVALANQPAASLHRAGSNALWIALILLLLEVYFAFKGRRVRDEEVRPVYAKHLAERLSMQAEVSAAREAQLRLTSDRLPNSSYFAIAAACLPAYEVGGDFYDIFELEPGKLGVLVAEGGGRGLGAALSIAYAKGFLMPKVFNNGSGDNSPSEVIRSLQERLSVLLDQDSSIDIAYAVIDAADRQLRYARTGDFPAVRVAREGVSQLALPEEHTIKFKSSQTQREIVVTQGSLSLEHGDSIVFFTDGVAQDWEANRTSADKELGKVIRSSDAQSAEKLQQELTKTLSDCVKRSRKQTTGDDLTAVIIRLENDAA